MLDRTRQELARQVSAIENYHRRQLKQCRVRAYEPRWTEERHAEWTRNVLADYQDVTPTQPDRTHCFLLRERRR